jgi:hypothetical protein
MQLLDQIEIDLGDPDEPLTVYIDVDNNSLARKWLNALNHLLGYQYHLEKNYCWFGFATGPRNGDVILAEINRSIQAINNSGIGYWIDNYYTIDDCASIKTGVNHKQMNLLHRYFEDLQGQAGAISPYYTRADATTRWHIRQLNLLCHEFESWALSWRKLHTAPEWQRPSQLLCWLNAPRYELTEEDYDLFGIDTINRDLGGVYVGVNKAVGKHHWEVFQDEGRDSRIGELTTTTLATQTLAAGDFDIEWANNPGAYEFQRRALAEFRAWLIDNNIDPDDRGLTIGHPKIGQVDLVRSFGTVDYARIWAQLGRNLNVVAVRTSSAEAQYPYNWTDADFIARQVAHIERGD